MWNDCRIALDILLATELGSDSIIIRNVRTCLGLGRTQLSVESWFDVYSVSMKESDELCMRFGWAEGETQPMDKIPHWGHVEFSLTIWSRPFAQHIYHQHAHDSLLNITGVSFTEAHTRLPISYLQSVQILDPDINFFFSSKSIQTSILFSLSDAFHNLDHWC